MCLLLCSVVSCCQILIVRRQIYTQLKDTHNSKKLILERGRHKVRDGVVRKKRVLGAGDFESCKGEEIMILVGRGLHVMFLEMLADIFSGPIFIIPGHAKELGVGGS